MAVLGLRFCARTFSSCGERGPPFITVRGPPTIAASLVAGHRLQTRRLSSCGPRAQLLRGMWDPPRPGHEPVSPALAGGFPTTAPREVPGIDYVLLQHLVMFDREHSDKPRPNKLDKKIQKGAMISGGAVVVPIVIINHSLVDAFQGKKHLFVL